MEKRNIIVTNALIYANGPVHLGHMLGYVQTDIWSRFMRMCGHTCYYVCGSDAHGTPIMLRAEKEGIAPAKMVANMAEHQAQDYKDFSVEFDAFYSTHHEENTQFVQQVYNTIKEQGDIEQKVIKQAYDPVKNMFLPDRYVKGTCPRCGAEDQYGDSCENCGATYSPTELINPISTLSGEAPVEKESTHYFFKLSNYESILKEWVNGGHLQSEVAHKLNEWFESGLKDWDISRDAPYFGVKIPGEEEKFFYVWFDAPLGYLVSFKRFCDAHPELDFNQFWQEESDTELYHFIGKDILYFHALFWPAMLKSARLKLPDAVFVNGFLTVNGQKMSKSRGTFINARTYLNHLDAAYLRYYYAAKSGAHIEDIDLNLEDFIQRVNSDLVGKVINIASRCAGFIKKKFDGQLSATLANEGLFNECVAAREQIANLYEKREFSQAVRLIMSLADKANQYIDQKQPWVLAKDENTLAEVQPICTMGINLFRLLMIYLKPIVPMLAEKTESFLNIQPLMWDDLNTPLLGHTINKFKPMLMRVEQDHVDAIMAEGK